MLLKTPLPSETLIPNLLTIAILIITGIIVWWVVVKILPRKKKKAKEIHYDFEEWSPYEYDRKTIKTK